METFNRAVREVREKMPKAKGAYGRRHHSRGLTGFFDKTQAKRRPCVELAGWDLLEILIEEGDEVGAESLFEQLTQES